MDHRKLKSKKSDIQHHKSDLDKLVQPDEFGPGIWQVIHILAKKVKYPNDVPQFVETLEDILSSLFCLECSTHAINYLNTNPPENYITLYDTDSNFIGMFYWSWEFHNTVNKRLGKPIMSWPEAFRLFSHQNICRGNCGSGIIDNSRKNNVPITRANNKKF